MCASKLSDCVYIYYLIYTCVYIFIYTYGYFDLCTTYGILSLDERSNELFDDCGNQEEEEGTHAPPIPVQTTQLLGKTLYIEKEEVISRSVQISNRKIDSGFNDHTLCDSQETKQRSKNTTRNNPWGDNNRHYCIMFNFDHFSDENVFSILSILDSFLSPYPCSSVDRKSFSFKFGSLLYIYTHYIYTLYDPSTIYIHYIHYTIYIYTLYI